MKFQVKTFTCKSDIGKFMYMSICSIDFTMQVLHHCSTLDWK